MTATTHGTPLDVKEGSVILFHGVRCRASNVRHIPEAEFGDKWTPKNGPVARYTLTSEPTAEFPTRLPGAYDGGTYGGNRLAHVCLLNS